MHSSPPNPSDSKPVIPYATNAQGKKLWTAGTLTYTTGGLLLLFFWLLFGDFAVAMRDRTVGDVVQLMLKGQTLSNTYISFFMVTMPPCIALFLVPIISFKSDRFRSRWGRRVPFLLIPIPLIVVSMLSLAFAPQFSRYLDVELGANSPGPKMVFMILFGVLWSVFEISSLTVAPLFGGLINDIVPRPLLGRFYGLFRLLSLSAGVIEGRFLLKYAETHLTEIFILIGAIYGIGFTIMLFMVKEGEYPPPVDPAFDDRSKGAISNMKTYFRECFAQPYYLWVFSAMLLAGLTFNPFNSFSLLYARQLDISLEAYGTMKAVSYASSMILAFPLGMLVDKFHPLRVGIAAQILYFFSVLYGSIFVHDTTTFGIAFIAHTILSGTYFTATASLPNALFPKLKFGQFAAAAGQVGALGAISLGLVLGPILDWSNSNYRLTLVMGLVLCSFTIVSLFVVYRRFMNLGGPANYIAPDNAPIPLTEPGFEVLPPK